MGVGAEGEARAVMPQGAGQGLHIHPILQRQRCEGVPEEKRDARFVCVIACAYPDGNVITTKGVIEGKLAHEPKGTHGFGYDPIFYLPERGCTTGELLPEEKNKISHRGIALRKMVEKLNEQA